MHTRVRDMHSTGCVTASTGIWPINYRDQQPGVPAANAENVDADAFSVEAFRSNNTRPLSSLQGAGPATGEHERYRRYDVNGSLRHSGWRCEVRVSDRRALTPGRELDSARRTLRRAGPRRGDGVLGRSVHGPRAGLTCGDTDKCVSRPSLHSRHRSGRRRERCRDRCGGAMSMRR